MVLLLELVTINSPWYLMPAVFWVIAIALQLLLAFYLHLRERFIVKRRRIKVAKNSPCQHCCYFDNNPFLNCALHPTDALRNQSENCRDYRPRMVTQVQNSTLR